MECVLSAFIVRLFFLLLILTHLPQINVCLSNLFHTSVSKQKHKFDMENVSYMNALYCLLHKLYVSIEIWILHLINEIPHSTENSIVWVHSAYWTVNSEQKFSRNASAIVHCRIENLETCWTCFLSYMNS